MRLVSACALAVVLLSLVGGCDRLFEKGSEEALGRAREKEREGDYRAAVRWYEAGLDGTVRTAEAHYSMGLIYDDKLSDPVAALAHYRRYLELDPAGAHVAEAKSFAEQDEFKLRNMLSGGNFMPQQDAVWLKNQNFLLQKQVTDARRELAEARALEKAAPGKAGEPVQKAIPEGATTYTVEPGDTFRSISRRFFNSPNHWEAIEEANFEGGGGTVKLRVGMVVMIPKG